MDPTGTISQRVYRDGTRYIDGKYVKDLSALNRPLNQTVIIDDNADCISMQVCVLKELPLLIDVLPVPRVVREHLPPAPFGMRYRHSDFPSIQFSCRCTEGRE